MLERGEGLYRAMGASYFDHQVSRDRPAKANLQIDDDAPDLRTFAPGSHPAGAKMTAWKEHLS